MLIAFEGIDGSGKSTQAAMLSAWLETQGYPTVSSKEPTDGPFGQRLRASFVSGRLPAQAELELFVADRREHVEQVVRPSLARGAVVVIDRYYYSTVAYQGARGLDRDAVLALNESFAPRPDVVFLVDVDPRLALQRIAARRGGHDLLENLDEQLKVRDAFLALARAQPNFVVVDGAHPTAALHGQIAAEVRTRLAASRSAATPSPRS